MREISTADTIDANFGGLRDASGHSLTAVRELSDRSVVSGHGLRIFDKIAYMWTVEYLLPTADERANLPPNMRARLQRMVDTIQVHGLQAMPRDWVKPLGDKLWELRITGKDGIACAIYVTATGRRVVIVRIFVKKTQKDTETGIGAGPATGKGGQMSMNTVKADNLHAENMAHDPAYRDAYEALEGEFSMINALIEARTRAKLTQAEVASRMGTTESAISRLESGRVKPSTRTLERYAQATGHKLKIRLEPALAR